MNSIVLNIVTLMVVMVLGSLGYVIVSKMTERDERIEREKHEQEHCNCGHCCSEHCCSEHCHHEHGEDEQ